VAQSSVKILAFSLVLLICLHRIIGSETARADPVKVMDSVVSVLPEWVNPKSRAKEPEGSGIVVLDGSTILTARHVIHKALSVRIRTRDGRILLAEVIGHDRLTDLAILSIGEKLPAVGFGRDAILGERACAIGNAFGLGLSMTCGIISATHKAGVGFNPIEDFVQTDAAVNPGASGGALVADDGALLGVLSAIFTKDSDANIGVNFAVSSRLAKRVAHGLAKDHKMHWRFSGLKLNPAVLKGDTGTIGAVVINVIAKSPGFAAGIKTGDVVRMLANRRIRKPQDFTGEFVSHPSGAILPVKIIRENSELVLKIQVPG